MFRRITKQHINYFKKSAITGLLLSVFSLSVFAKSAVEPEALTAENGDDPASYYTGFSQLLDDEKLIVDETLLDIDEDVERLALYHNGDRLHRKIPKQVHLMIENKLMSRLLASERFDVVQCIECRTTKVRLADDELVISQAAENNKELRSLSKRVRVDGLLFWNASVHRNKFTVNLRLVDGRDNSLLWLKEFSKKTTKELEEKGFDTVSWEVLIGAWGIGAERESTGAAKKLTLDGVTSFGIRRREATSLNEKIEYTLGVEYFRNFSNTDSFNVNGVSLEGRIIADISELDELVETNVYLGIGQSFFNNNNSLLFRLGVEFPFFSDGFMDFGVIYMPKTEVEFKDLTDYESKGTIGGASYDLTLGVRF